MPCLPSFSSFRSRPTLSMVVATYNVDAYIVDFFESILKQTDGLDGLEVIIVNDGSTDQSGRIAQKWSARYPEIFHYIVQDNQGVAAARNTGLQQATGEWICFPDPDDFFSPNYLAEMRTEMMGWKRQNLVAVVAPFIFYHESTDTYTDDHPLRGRFRSKVKRYNSTDMGHVLLPHTSNTFMRRSEIMKHGLIFDTRIRPTFEDAHFIIRLLLYCPGRVVSFLPDPVYYYRKRQTGDSLVDGVVANPEWYGPHLKHAYLSLLREAFALRGQVPAFVQNNVLFSLLSKLRYLIGPNYDPNVLQALAQNQFVDGLDGLMEYIDLETLENTSLSGFFPIHRQSLIARFKSDADLDLWVELRNSEPNSTDLALRWVVGGDAPDTVTIEIDGQQEPIDMRTCKTYMLFDQVYGRVFSHKIAKFPQYSLRILSQGRPLPINYKKKNLGTCLTYDICRMVLNETRI